MDSGNEFLLRQSKVLSSTSRLSSINAPRQLNITHECDSRYRSTRDFLPNRLAHMISSLFDFLLSFVPSQWQSFSNFAAISIYFSCAWACVTHFRRGRGRNVYDCHKLDCSLRLKSACLPSCHGDKININLLLPRASSSSALRADKVTELNSAPHLAAAVGFKVKVSRSRFLYFRKQRRRSEIRKRKVVSCLCHIINFSLNNSRNTLSQCFECDRF
jgi:hypothetical protein